MDNQEAQKANATKALVEEKFELDGGKKLKEDISVLLVEDDEDDVRLTQRAFNKGKILNRLYVVREGEEAMEFRLQRLLIQTAHTSEAVSNHRQIPATPARTHHPLKRQRSMITHITSYGRPQALN